MLFSTFCNYLSKLDSTNSRLEITAILASLLKESLLDEIDKVCYLLLGRLGPLFDNPQFNIAEKMMIRAVARAVGVSAAKVTEEFKVVGDLGEVVEKLKTQSSKPKATSQSYKVGKSGESVEDIYQNLLEIANYGGAGSQERKLKAIETLIRDCSSQEAKYLVRITLGAMRLGFSDKTILDALSWMLTGDKSHRGRVDDAYNVYPDIGRVAFLLKKSGLTDLRGLKAEVGVPISPQLCQRLNDFEEILKKQGGVSAVETKFDGTRVQLHMERGLKVKSGGKVGRGENLKLFGEDNIFIKTFTRNLEDTTHQFPEITASAKKLSVNSVILDGEAIGINKKTGRFLAFQQTITRKRKHGVEAAAKEVALVYIAFDILLFNGKSLLNIAFKERRAILKKLIGEGSGIIRLSSQVQTKSAKDLKDYFLKEVRRGGEGVVIKDLRSQYKAGGRGFAWVKVKEEKDTIDCVVMGCFKGEGKRADFGVGRLLLGLYDRKSDSFITVGKVGSGFTDEEWRILKKLCDKLAVSKMPKNYKVAKLMYPDTWLRPKVVMAVRCDNITVSPTSTSGYSLRFPRFISWREDKGPQETTTIGEIPACRQAGLPLRSQ